MKRERKQWSGAEKLAILKRHLVEKVPISNLCDEYQLQPSQVYAWQAQLFEHGTAAFERKPGRPAAETAKDRQITQLQAKLVQKNEVIGELLQEHVQLKKELGEL